ncbi:MAG TPA: tripartite tricarboxylate transporter substrate binding protein [Burkholderiales bacterium]|nr:tripartite tricarboxylate transporter substrate binding protein [Burkholderiales bacterium]
MHRRHLLKSLAGLALGARLPCGLAADTYPSKTIRLVVPFAAGSATDSAGRLFAQELSKRLGQQVIVDNRAGAFGQIAAELVARSAPDGYTLFMTTNTTHAANPHLFRSLNYDPIKDFVPVARLGILPFMVVVPPGMPAKSMGELITYARANPGSLSYAHPSSASLVAMETIKRLAKIDMVGVQYKASPQAMIDLIAGRVQVMAADFATAVPQVRAGKLRVLAVTGAKRSALLPDVPPVADTLPGFDIVSWNGLFLPAGTPPAIVDRLARASLDILSQAENKAKLAALGYEVDPQPPEAFGRYVRDQILVWGKLIQAAGIPKE